MNFKERIRFLLDSSRPVDREVAKFVTFQTPDKDHDHEGMIGMCDELVSEVEGLKKLLTPPVLVISRDDGSEMDPRVDWDNLGTMVCWHPHYNLGDKQPGGDPETWYLENAPFFVALPLFLYDHGGLTMSTGAFSCPWDSGQVGWIFVTAEEVRQEFKVKALNGAIKDRVIKCLEAEVRVYDQRLRGAVWGFTHGDDSCWGFLGDELEETGLLEHISAPRDVVAAAWEART